MNLRSKPILCNYYLTYRCNASCGFCDIWEKPSPYVTIEQVKQNFSALKKLGVKIIDFTGGEPLLHQQLPEILKMAKAMGFITTVTTNTLLYPKMAHKLKGLIDMLHFSLDSSNANTHDQMRGVACFDFVMESIQLAVAMGERPDILFTVFEHNMDEIESVYQQICAPNGLMLLLNPAFDYNSVDVGNGLSRLSLEKLKKYGNKKGVYLNEAFIQLRLDGGNHTLAPVCKAASTTVVINPMNELVVPCYHLGEKTFPINNDLFDVYYSNEVKNVRALEGRLPACEGCTINCYMQPSFATQLNKYFWLALPSTLKYNYYKGTWKSLFMNR
jgi:MoaA/NifB/PqqE/SkfB family radical SAM enzyme